MARPVAAQRRSPPSLRSPQPTTAPPPQDVKTSAALKPASKVVRQRALALTMMMMSGGIVVAYGTMLYISTSRKSELTRDSPQTQSELTSVYDRTASSFDADVGLTEWMTGMLNTRADLAGQCKGHVLEVSAGTGRNLGYYRFGGKDGIKSLTLVDISREMVEQGKLKWAALRQKAQLKGEANGVPVRFWQGDVKGTMPGPPQEAAIASAKATVGSQKEGYDTIVQTMGLCSTDEPVQLLKSISSHLDRTNPEAKIFLMEHGRGYYDWLNKILDNGASQHACKHGCWWNRDIGAIVRDSGLEVVQEKRKQFGTTWIYELRPQKTIAVAPEVASSTVDDSKNEELTGLSAWLPRWTYEKICKR